MEQTKALFFAQYWGQAILRFPFVDERSPQSISAPVDFSTLPSWALYKEYNYFSVNNGYLLLRSVNQLTDEECYQIDLLLNSKSEIDIKSNKTIFDLHVKIVKDILTDGYWSFNRSIWDLQPVLCYIRSIGIILPFTYIDETGKPVTLSVEEIIALRWAKVKA